MCLTFFNHEIHEIHEKFLGLLAPLLADDTFDLGSWVMTEID